MKRQPTDWENIFANDVTDKGLVSKIHKQLMMFNSIKQTTHSKNGQMDSTDILQRSHTDGQQAHGKMFDNTNYYRNENQNQNEVAPHTSQNDYQQKIHKK